MPGAKAVTGVFSDVLVVHELRGSFPDVPIAAGVDYAALIEGDDDPVFLTIPIGKAGVTSGNKRHYDEAFVQELARQTLELRPVGLMGHLPPDQRAHAFPTEAVHWVGATRLGDTLWGKGYVPPGPVRDRIRRYKAQGKALATSIDAFVEGAWDSSLGAYRMQAQSLRLNQIDLAPADRAGIPSLAQVPILTHEMAEDDEPEDSGGTTMAERVEIIREITVDDIDLIPRAVKQEIIAGVAPAPEVEQMRQVRSALGLGDKADVLGVVTEMVNERKSTAKAAVAAKVAALLTDKEKGVAATSLHGLITEMVMGRNPRSVAEAESAYAAVVGSEAVKKAVASQVQETLGPNQRVGGGNANGNGDPHPGRAGKFFKIPTETPAKETA